MASTRHRPEEPSDLEREIEQGQSEGRIHRALARFKAFTHRHPLLRLVHKIVVTVVGGLVVLAGIIMLVTPGPGWLGIFLGLGILATEYPVVHRFNLWAKAKVLAVWRRLVARRNLRRERKDRRRAQRQARREEAARAAARRRAERTQVRVLPPEPTRHA